MTEVSEGAPNHSPWLLLRLACGMAALALTALGHFAPAAWLVALAGAVAFIRAPRSPASYRESKGRRTARAAIDGLVFGAAPSFVALRVYLQGETWGWVVAGLFILAAVINVARSRVEPGPRASLTVQGLPAVVAGTLVASLYPFFGASALGPLLGGITGAQEVGGVMICFLILMVSPLPYPVLPPLRSRSGFGGREILLSLGAGAAIAFPNYVIFPAVATYAIWGIAESVTPVLTDGVVEDEGSASEGNGDEPRDGLPPPYQARSTWE